VSTLTFEYRAVDRAGAQHRGTTEAPSEAEAYRLVTARGLIPVTIRRAGNRVARAARFNLRDIAHFTAQLAVLVGARVPISDGLLSIAEQEHDPRLAAVIKDLAARIEAGSPLADAMSAHAGVFGDVYVETIRAAERSGNLVKVLESVSEMLERAQEINQQVKSALMYPLCVVAVLVLGLVFLIGFVVPRFGEMFASRGVELPLLTQWLVWVGNGVKQWWIALGGVGAVAALGARRAWRTPGGRLAMDRFFHRVPAVRDVLVGLAISRLTRVLGISLSSGLGLIESLEMAGRATGRPILMDDVERMARQVRSGGRLSAALAGCTYLTPFCKRMMTAGEQSGELPKMCALVARHYDRESAHLSKNLATAIEPVMIVLIAGAVLVVALAIFMPMWSMGSLIK